MRLKYVEEVRAFSRFYTVLMGVLDKKFLKEKYTLVETRIMHLACINDGIMPSEIVNTLNIDKSYLSRILTSLEKRKVIKKIESKKDGRSVNVRITNFGKLEFEKMTKTSNKEIEGLLVNLSDAECERLIKKMHEIKELLESGRGDKV
ncbi:MAG TPA: MarR family winged helix-turn-helix transcriptional regulator [Saprospiraceae bacterium]|nr:MarR family winged helix-turn-helix transcriptional regulator [Saprospiraceae bacterium]